jgi:hypothetical protein
VYVVIPEHATASRSERDYPQASHIRLQKQKICFCLEYADITLLNATVAYRTLRRHKRNSYISDATDSQISIQK